MRLAYTTLTRTTSSGTGNFCEKERKLNLYTNAPMVELVYLVSDANENKEVL